MFEKQKWSKALKQTAEDFFNILSADGNEISNEDFARLVLLIDMAREEGKEEVLDNPSDYDVAYTPPDWEDDEDCR